MSENNDVKNNTQDKRLLFIDIVLLGLLLCGCNQKPKVYHVGILSGLDFFADTADGFKAKMAELGYREDINIVYDIRKTQFETVAEQRILKKFVTDKVDLIVTFPTEVSLEAKAVANGTNIPVVFANANVEGVNLVKSVREPGGNITGVRYPGPDLAIKRFEIMRMLAPKAKRMWVPYQRGYPIVVSQLEVLRATAAAAGVTLIETPADNAAELQAILRERPKPKNIGMDAVLFIAEPLAVTPDAFAVISKFAAEHEIPVGGALMIMGDYGSVFGVSTDNVAVGRQAAVLADKILKGIPAGSIPVVSAENFLQINYKAARRLGLKVPEGLLSQANEIIR
jgi:putative ABC transport system substrate-binding protein